MTGLEWLQTTSLCINLIGFYLSLRAIKKSEKAFEETIELRALYQQKIESFRIETDPEYRRQLESYAQRRPMTPQEQQAQYGGLDFYAQFQSQQPMIRKFPRKD